MANIDMGSVLGGTGAVLSVLTMIYTAINHKRIRGRCCGREIDIELNIDSTDPKDAAAAAAAAAAAGVTPKAGAQESIYASTPPESPVLRSALPRPKTPRAASAGKGRVTPKKVYPAEDDYIV